MIRVASGSGPVNHPVPSQDVARRPERPTGSRKTIRQKKAVNGEDISGPFVHDAGPLSSSRFARSFFEDHAGEL